MQTVIILFASDPKVTDQQTFAASTDPASPLQTLTHVTIQNTTTSVQDPLPGHQGHQAAIIIPPRDDGKLWVGTVTWTASKPVELVILHGYINVTTADSAHGVPLIAKPRTGALAITLIGSNQFMPSSNPVHIRNRRFCR